MHSLLCTTCCLTYHYVANRSHDLTRAVLYPCCIYLNQKVLLIHFKFVTWCQRWDEQIPTPRATLPPRKPSWYLAKMEATFWTVHDCLWQQRQERWCQTRNSIYFTWRALKRSKSIIPSPGMQKQTRKRKVHKLMEKFEVYCTPRQNVTWDRHFFNSRTQQPGKTIDQYVTDLRCKAKHCEFGTLTYSLIRDRKTGTLGPHSTGKMGTRVPQNTVIMGIPWWKWGPPPIQR